MKDGKIDDPCSDAQEAYHSAEPMFDASEDEFEEDFNAKSAVESKEDKEKTEAAAKERTARKEKLKNLFDDDDDDVKPGMFINELEVRPNADRPPTDEDVDMFDAPEPEEEPEDDAPIDKEVAKAPEPEPEPEPTVAGGRRRAKRKVMKKKTVKDEEGYLGTFSRCDLFVPSADEY